MKAMITKLRGAPFMLIETRYQLRHLSTTTTDDVWNSAWETAWLPPDNSHSLPIPPDTETRAFLEDMNDNWELRRRPPAKTNITTIVENNKELDNMKTDYRIKKQRIHAGLWVKEIHKREEYNLMGDDQNDNECDDIQKLLDSCSEIFDSPNVDLDNSKIPSSSELKNKPDGWETTAKEQDGSVWQMSQREEDILLQEFERRIAFCKFQIASFIKTHIFSRRRPIDGWKYMIEEIGPNARKGKGSVLRTPSLSDEATQPFREERTPIASNAGYIKGR